MTATPSPLDDRSRTPEMFTSIARRYDLLNHLLSMNVDRSWRRALVRAAMPVAPERVLDVATGTGDVAIAFARHSDAQEIVGIDPSEGMLEVGREKLARLGLQGRVRMQAGDALALPYESGGFDAVTIAFGLRNLPDFGAGIAEMARVLRPGGRLLVLEFFPPRGGLFLKAYRFYLGRVLPLAGRVISGSPEAYRYLAASIENFVSHEDIRTMMAESGLVHRQARRLTGGIAWIHEGERV
jgi:demethylmenaquinone methyltransferase/2-methoxy-6-polyprenyl-1,4-benzoquinol methylase